VNQSTWGCEDDISSVHLEEPKLLMDSDTASGAILQSFDTDSTVVCEYVCRFSSP
jgi:hypothetical protein